MQTQQAEDKKPHLKRQLPLCRSPYGNYPLYTEFFSDILLKKPNKFTLEDGKDCCVCALLVSSSR